MNDKAKNPKLKNEKPEDKQKPNKRNRDKKIYDLEERTAVFGERIIDFVKTLPDNVINRELIRQLIFSSIVSPKKAIG